MRKPIIPSILTLLVLFAAGPSSGAGLPPARPEAVGMSSSQLVLLDALIEEAIAQKAFPGAVVLVARKGRVVYRKAFGLSQTVPEPRPLTADMLFDQASITKPVATATSVMILVERGRLRLWDKVKTYVPSFSAWYGEKGVAGEDARLYHLLTHTSGLPPYTDAKEAALKLGDPCTTADLAGLIAAIPKERPVGAAFVYSCLNYITLAHIVQVVSGRTVAEFAEENVFKPLGMTRTSYRPPASLLEACVPTEVVDGRPLRGIVHDPLARLQGGVSGNAGLFSTADDLAVFAQMLLGKGALGGARVLSPLTVERMTEVFPMYGKFGRGLGWDLETDYSTSGGDLFGSRAYGHTGYTGTSIWIDPATGTTVVFLTNRVHPDDKGDVIALRSKVANVVAAAIRPE